MGVFYLDIKDLLDKILSGVYSKEVSYQMNMKLAEIYNVSVPDDLQAGTDLWMRIFRKT